jgi:hypothetical protein
MVRDELLCSHGLIKENRSDGWRSVTFSDFSTGMDDSASLLEQFSNYMILTHSSNNFQYEGCLRTVMIWQVELPWTRWCWKATFESERRRACPAILDGWYWVKVSGQ